MTYRWGLLAVTAWLVVALGVAGAQELEDLDEDQLRKRIAVHLDNKRVEEALEATDQWVVVAPRSPEAFAMRARLRESLGQLEGSLEDHSRLLAMDPGRISSWAKRAALRVQLGDEEGAIEDATHALEQDPTLALAWFARGLARAELGQHQAAIGDFDRAIEVSPPHPKALHARGRARQALGEEQAAKADFSSALELDARAAQPWGQRRRARTDGNADLSHVKVGQAYHYALQNGMKTIWTVLEVSENRVRYEMLMLMDMGQGLQAVGEPQEQTWKFRPPQPGDAAKLPADVETSRETITVSGIEFDCLVVSSDAGGVVSRSWCTMTPGSETATTFPGIMKAFMDGDPAMVLVKVEAPKN